MWWFYVAFFSSFLFFGVCPSPVAVGNTNLYSFLWRDPVFDRHYPLVSLAGTNFFGLTCLLLSICWIIPSFHHSKFSWPGRFNLPSIIPTDLHLLNRRFLAICPSWIIWRSFLHLLVLTMHVGAGYGPAELRRNARRMGLQGSLSCPIFWGDQSVMQKCLVILKDCHQK